MQLITKQPSELFKTIIGKQNYPLTKIEIDILRYYFVRDAVNLRCQFEDERGSWVFAPSDILKNANRSFSRDYKNCLEAIRDYYPKKAGVHIDRYTQLYAFHTNLRERESINELALLYGFGSLLDENPKGKKGNRALEECEYLDIRIPPLAFFPQELITSIGTYKRNSLAIPLTAPYGRLLGGVVHYQDVDGRVIYFPGQIVGIPDEVNKHPALIPGKYPRPNYLIREHMLEQRPDTVVLFCACLKVAEHLNALQQENYEPGDLRQITVTAPVGGINDLATPDLGGLKGKYVVYIPDVTRESYFAANEVERLCHEAGAVSFKILREPVLCHQLAEGQIEIDALDDPWERYLTTHAITLTGSDSLSLRTIADRAVTLSEFLEWGVETNLIRANDEPGSPTGCHSLITYTEPTLEEVSQYSKSEILLDFLTSYQRVGAIIAEPHAGKTQFAISYCVASCAGLPFLHFTSSPTKRVCYFDAETPRLDFEMSMAQSINAFNADSRIIKDSFKYRILKEENHDEAIDISKEKFQKNFELSIEEHRADIVVFDNLINLVPEFRNTGRYNWQDIWKWMNSLEREYKTSIIIVHHDNGKGDSAGTKDIRTQCSTVLFLQDPRSKFAKGEWAKGADSPFANYILKKGVLFKATIEKCRSYPNAVYSEFGAFFAYDAEQPVVGRPWELIDVSNSQIRDTESTPEAEREDSKMLYPGRTEREYVALNLCREKGRVTRKDLEQAIDKSEATCGNVLKKLRDDGLLDKRESGPATYYTLRRGKITT